MTPKEIRTALNLSQVALAEEIGCHQSAVSRAEASPSRMSGMLRRAYERLEARLSTSVARPTVTAASRDRADGPSDRQVSA
ncbi:helix-turn-helix transcriptional regulator [Stappia sp. F7233]|uniref:Helix-turn-helix transcriptional regulator n=1 Tax=Stappia albiluteola TaxID=2758565 RepID=A0A839AEU9_9HYPH|nr:helix-turn-helix transcriptional regulator [Stappia albiluteola]